MNFNGMFFGLLTLIGFVTCSSSGEKNEQISETGFAGPGWNVTIQGKIKEAEAKGKIILISEVNNPTNVSPPDTIWVQEDLTYKSSVTLNEPGYYAMDFFGQQKITIILYKSDLVIDVDGKRGGEVAIKGSPELDFFNKANEILNSLNDHPNAIALQKEFDEARRTNDQNRMMKLQMTYQEMLLGLQEKVAALIKEDPLSLGVINFLQSQNLDKDRFSGVYVFVADALKKEWPEYLHAKQFIDMVDKMRATAVGQQAPEIALPNPEGDVISLSSLRGKYVLVDFWAKWCGPCRAENPNVVRAFKKYKDKGFTVFGVSLDRKKSDWVQAIEDDGLTWTHVSDLKFWQSEAAQDYNVTSIPFSLLLDPKGIIIAKNLRGQALDDKLEEVLGD